MGTSEPVPASHLFLRHMPVCSPSLLPTPTPRAPPHQAQLCITPPLKGTSKSGPEGNQSLNSSRASETPRTAPSWGGERPTPPQDTADSPPTSALLARILFPTPSSPYSARHRRHRGSPSAPLPAQPQQLLPPTSRGDPLLYCPHKGIHTPPQPHRFSISTHASCGGQTPPVRKEPQLPPPLPLHHPQGHAGQGGREHPHPTAEPLATVLEGCNPPPPASRQREH